MKQLKEIMTSDVQVMRPDARLTEVASQMKKLDVGAIPICDEDRLVGMVTDRDIVLRTLGESQDPRVMFAKDVMHSPIVYCYEDQTIEEAARLMEVKQIRRLVVLNRDKRLVGIVSVGDLAVKTGSEELSGEVLEKISQPARKIAA